MLRGLGSGLTENILSEVKMLKGIYKHYNYSPKALREIREIASVLEEDFILLVNILGTRWLPQRALVALLRNYQVIIAHFNDTAADRSESADGPRYQHSKKAGRTYLQFALSASC